MALVSTVGGASGPLYGTAFMQAGKALAGKTELCLLYTSQKSFIPSQDLTAAGDLFIL